MGEVRVDDVFGVSGLDLVATGVFSNPGAPPPEPQEPGTPALQLEITGNPPAFLKVFDEDLKVSAKAGASLKVVLHRAGAAVKGTFEESVTPPNLGRWCEFAINGALEAGASGSTTYGAWQLSASGTASAEVEYRHLLPISANESIRSSVKNVLSGSRAPGRFVGEVLIPGEEHHFAGRLRFGLDLKAGIGRKFEYQSKALELFKGFSPQIKATAEATLDASLGLALFESTEISALGLESGAKARMRLRVKRTRDRGLTLGARLGLGVQHNIGNILAATLDHVFDLKPVADAVSLFREVAKYSDAKSWDELRAKLSDKAGDTLVRLLWKNVDLEDFADFTSHVGKFLDEYNKVDSRLHDLWYDILEHAKIDGSAEANLRSLLGKLVEASEFNLRGEVLAAISEKLQGEEGQALLRLIELLTGDSLEELISKPETTALEAAIKKAGELAQQALDFLDSLNGEALKKISQALQTYAEESGIAGVVKWLTENASSLPTLKGALEKQVRKVVSRLFHKAWENLLPGEIALLTQWAKAIDDHLKDFDTWKARLKADLKKLDKKIGLTLAFEVSRQFHREALLDVELEKSLWDEAAAALRKGDIPGLARRIWEEIDEDEDSGVAHFHECAFLSRKTRTSGWTLMMEAFGLSWLLGRKRTRVVESLEKISAGKERTLVVRGLSDLKFSDSWKIWQSGAELLIEGQGGAPGDRFLPSRSTIALNVIVEDNNVTAEELDAIANLFAELGLGSVGNRSVVEAVGENKIIKVGLQIQFVAEHAVLLEALSHPADRPGWYGDIKVAAKRLFEERLARSPFVLPGVTAGALWAALLANNSAFAAAAGPAEGMVARLVAVGQVNVQGQPINISSLPEPAIRAAGAILNDLRTLGERESFRRAHEVADWLRDFRAAGSTVDLDAYERLAKEFAELHNCLRLILFRNPMLGFWVLLNKLTGLQSHGSATVQARETDDAEWSVPAIWER